MAKVKAKTKSSKRGVVRFSKDIPYQMAMACKSLQPFFTSLQIAGLTGIKKEHVQKTLSVWKKAKLVEVVGEGKHDNAKAPFYLYTITSNFEKQLDVVGSKKVLGKKVTQVVPTIPAALIDRLRKVASEFQEIGKIIG
jgi:transcription initiation factor IIE alpha subunit